MSPAFGPDDQEAFEAARDRIVAEFERAGGSRFLRVAEQVLNLKWSYLDGDLARWSMQDVEAILLDVYPAKVLLDERQIGEVPTAFAALLRFLGRDRPDQEASLETLAQHVERMTRRFYVAMSDDDKWSFGKRMWSTAVAEGVDLADPTALDRWVQQFNERPLGERDQILGRMPAIRSGIGAALIGALEPVVLPTDEKLRALAFATAQVQRLTKLVDYVGAGRTVTDRGNLKLADGKELVTSLGTDDRFDERIGEHVYKTRSSTELSAVDLTYRVALAAKLLIVEGRRLIRGPNAGWIRDDSLALWYAAFLALVQEVGPTQHHYGDDRYGFSWFAEDLDRQLPSLLVEFYRDRESRELDQLVEHVWRDLNATYDLADVAPDKLEFHRSLVDSALRRAFDRLAELGIVTIADEIRTATEFGGSDRSGGTVFLGPLGLCALQRMLSRVTDAPVAGALRSLPASELLRATADMPENLARAELDAWIDQHGDTAAADLCGAVRDADEVGRGIAFRALLQIGSTAADDVARLADDAELAAFVTLWRVDTLTAEPQEMDRSGDPEGWVRLLHTVVELWGPQVCAAVWAVPAAGAPGIDAMLNVAWRVQGNRTEEVLAAIGAHHPEKHIAKAARKALFKYRSAG
jgi:hypothetical protein